MRPNPETHRMKANVLRIGSKTIRGAMSSLNDAALALQEFDGDHEALTVLVDERIGAERQWDIEKKAYFATEVNFLDDYRDYMTDAVEYEMNLFERMVELLERIVVDEVDEAS